MSGANSAAVRPACLRIERSVPDAFCGLPVQGHDDGTMTARFPPELDVAASLAHLHTADLGQCSDDVGAAGDRQPRPHADSWTVAMIGGSIPSGRLSSSKCSSSASRKFA